MASTNSVVRAAMILRHLARADGPVPLAVLSRELAIPKSTAHSILRSLERERFVDPSPGGYVVGLGAFEVGASHLRSFEAGDMVRPELLRLTRDLGTTAHWAVVDGLDAVYLAKESPPEDHSQLASSLGGRLPAYTTAVGKSCLAWLPRQRWTQHVPVDLDLTALERLEDELAQVRTLGYSTDDRQSAQDIMCVAAPLRTGDRVKGAIGISFPVDSPLSLERASQAVIDAVRRAGDRLVKELAS